MSAISALRCSVNTAGYGLEVVRAQEIHASCTGGQHTTGTVYVMAELDVQAHRKGRGTYQAIVTNRGPDTVILNKIEGTKTDGFFVNEPLHRADLELIPGARHEFMVAPSLADAPPLEVDITLGDQSGPRTKTYPIYI